MNYEQKYHEALERANEAVKSGMVSQNFVDDIFGVESEDERIRKAIRLILIATEDEQKDFYSTHGLTRKGCTDWLEKLIDQKPDIELIQRSWYMDGYFDGEFKREPKWIIKTGKGGPRHELNPRYGEPLAEQKPIDFKLLSAGSGAMGTTPPSFKLDVKPTEWSEEDSFVLEDAITAADLLGNDDKYKESHPNLAKAFRVAKDWLKSLPNRFTLQPKQEWSVEDEALIENVCTALKGYALHERKVDLDEHAHRLEEMSERLKFLRPKPHWKPSDEQIEYLAKAIDTLDEEGDCKTAAVLNELRCDLKKLLK